ncbi:MAG TPA: flagellar hook-length control protein FliK [Solimonas sp.]|nr:flagellar hook-length control protein FliK [Solimonas sp.]
MNLPPLAGLAPSAALPPALPMVADDLHLLLFSLPAVAVLEQIRLEPAELPKAELPDPVAALMLMMDAPFPALSPVTALPAEHAAVASSPLPTSGGQGLRDAARTEALLPDLTAALHPSPSPEGRGEFAGMAAVVLPSTPTSAPTVPLPALPTPATPQPRWTEGLGERLVWATDAGLSEASIELHPEELGPIQIRIATEGNQASVSFQATNAATRQLLAQSLPQLRELLNGTGLELGRTQIGSLAPRREGEPRLPSERGSPSRRRHWRLGLVDDYV